MRSSCWRRIVAAAATTAALAGLAGTASAAAITFHTALPVGETPLVLREAPRSSDSARNAHDRPPAEGRLAGDKHAAEQSDMEHAPHAWPRAPGPEGR